jgi:hypothetical protein
MIDDADRYWGPAPGHSWRELPRTLERLKRSTSHPAGSDRIAPCEVVESNQLMARLGLRTRYRPDGRAYLIDAPQPDERTRNA